MFYESNWGKKKTLNTEKYLIKLVKPLPDKCSIYFHPTEVNSFDQCMFHNFYELSIIAKKEGNK